VRVSHGIPRWPPPAESPRRQQGLRLAYLGRITPSKGLHVLLEAVRRLRRPEIRVAIHGDIPPYGDIEDYAKRMRRVASRLPHVDWRGPYAHEALPDILGDADVVVVPSIWYENQPLVILEAFMARQPVVATDLGGMRELVHHERNGLVFPRGDAQALAACLTRLADEPRLLERLREGIAPVKGIEEHAAELEAVYRRVCASQPGCAEPAGEAAVAPRSHPS
jgi:glycosyltransferase involved in cell wall biosynthesis